jgi:hypothetical protein
MSDPIVRCKNCSYYVPEGENVKYGFCHYRAPVVAKEMGQSQWPVVRETQFCGQFELKSDVQDDASDPSESAPHPQYPENF